MCVSFASSHSRRLSRRTLPIFWATAALSMRLLVGLDTASAQAAPPNTDSARDEVPAPSVHLLLGGESGIGGSTGTMALDQHTSAYEWLYEQPQVLGNVGVEVRYLNEGYLGATGVPWELKDSAPLHYRDAYGLQLDYWSPWARSCRAGAAAGPELYFDTTTRTDRSAYEDRHGVGLNVSIAAQCLIVSPLAIEAIVSRSFDVASFNATTLVVGLVFTPPSGNTHSTDDGTIDPYGSQSLEITSGWSKVDCFQMSAETGSVLWLSYNHALTRAFALAGSVMDESVPQAFSRRSVAVQVVAHHSFWTRRLDLFAAIGPDVTRTHDAGTPAAVMRLNGLLSFGARLELWKGLSAVVRLGRVESADRRDDSDLITAGLSLRLG
jgi:hypothetical protein